MSKLGETHIGQRQCGLHCGVLEQRQIQWRLRLGAQVADIQRQNRKSRK